MAHWGEAASSARISKEASFTKPPEWSDEDRMHFLLAPFAESSSPSLQDPKLTFWTSLILSSSRELNRPHFTEEELKTRFKWNQTLSPCCIETVIKTMEKSGIVITEKEFVRSASPDGWLLWGLKVATTPLSWAYNRYSPSKYSGRYIIAAQVKEYAEKVITQHKQSVVHKSTDLVMKVAEFDTISCDVLSTDVLPLVKASLVRDGAIVIKSTDMGFDVLKICEGRDNISEVDVGIVRIKNAVSNVQEQVDSLAQRVQKFRQSAKENIKDKKKALRLLRQSKVVEGLLEKREAGLENLQTILQKIQSAESDAMILEAYKSSVSVLKSVSEGLTVERAEEVMGDLREAMEDNQEVTDVLSAGVGGDMNYDEDELERELADLVQPKPAKSGAVATSVGDTLLEDELEAQLASLSLKDLPSPPLSSLNSKDKTKLKNAKKDTPMLA